MTLNLTFDRHTIALIAIIGSSLDVLGALYLAYDLLGGEHGPLRTLTRAVTYGLLFGTGYGLAGGAIFGLATGITHGITLAWEFLRAARHQPKQGFAADALMSAIRGFGFGLGAAWSFGWAFGITFGLLSTIGQIVAYHAGMRPTIDYESAARTRITPRQLLGAANRTVGYAIAGYVSSLVAGHRDQAIAIGLKSGFVIGIVTAIFGAVTPLVEWGADHIPEKRMGVFGVGLILIGFTLQSLQYWVTLLDIPVH